MKTKFLLLIVGIVLMITSCSKDPVPEPGNGNQTTIINRTVTEGATGNLSSLSIQNAKNVFVTRKSATGGTRAEGTDSSINLYKTTVDGIVEKLPTEDEDGNPIVLDDSEVFSLTDDLIGLYIKSHVDVYDEVVVVEYKENVEPDPTTYTVVETKERYFVRQKPKTDTYWVRKSDGRAFLVPWQFSGMRGLKNYHGETQHQVDKNGNIYALVQANVYYEDAPSQFTEGIYKITSDDNGISAKEVTKDWSNESYYLYDPSWLKPKYVVDNNGNVYFGREYDRLQVIFSDGTKFLSPENYPKIENRNYYNIKEQYFYFYNVGDMVMLCSSDDGYYYAKLEEQYTESNDAIVGVYHVSADVSTHNVNVILVGKQTIDYYINRIAFEGELPTSDGGFYPDTDRIKRNNSIVSFILEDYDDNKQAFLLDISSKSFVLDEDATLRANGITITPSYYYWIKGNVIYFCDKISKKPQVAFQDADYFGIYISKIEGEHVFFSCIKNSTLERYEGRLVGNVYELNPAIGEGGDDVNIKSNEIISFIEI